MATRRSDPAHSMTGDAASKPHRGRGATPSKGDGFALAGNIAVTSLLAGEAGCPTQAGKAPPTTEFLATVLQRKGAGNRAVASVLPHGTPVQRTLTAAGQAYLDHILTDRTWGGYPEANAVATARGFQTWIYKITGIGPAARLTLMADIGAGAARAISLMWDGTHYVVIPGGGNLNGLAVPPTTWNPVGNGNCLYEALFYIMRDGHAIAARWGDSTLKNSDITNMRRIASMSLDPALANVLGEELMSDERPDRPADLLKSGQQQVEVAKVVSQLYDAYPPLDYYIKTDKRRNLLTPRAGKGGKETGDVNSEVLLKGMKVKDKELRDGVIAALLRDRAYQLVVEARKTELDVSGMVEVLNDKEAAMYLDTHQDKHQDPGSVIYAPWKHKRGTAFAPGQDAAWHGKNTAPTLKKWAVAQKLEEGESTIPKKVPLENDVIYDAFVIMQGGKLLISYHCNLQ